jgi:hypothetical protein
MLIEFTHQRSLEITQHYIPIVLLFYQQILFIYNLMEPFVKGQTHEDTSSTSGTIKSYTGVWKIH